MLKTKNIAALCFKANRGFVSLSTLRKTPFVRHLYTSNYFAIDKFKDQKQRFESQFGVMRDQFLDRMRNETLNEDQSRLNLIFSEDLKSVTFLAQTDDDLLLLENMIEKYTSKTDVIRFSSFVFGPVVLRLCHIMNKPDLALKFITETKYGDFFRQVSSYVLAMDLLFKNGLFKQVLDVHERYKSQFPNQNSKNIFLYTIAACYKLNTDESFKYAVDLLNEVRNSGFRLNRRSIVLLSNFALKKSNSVYALELLSLLTNHSYITVRNLRISALSMLGRVDDSLMMLRVALNEEARKNDAKIFRETLLKVKEAVEKRNDRETTAEFAQIERALIENKQIEEKTFEEIVFELEEPDKFKKELLEGSGEEHLKGGPRSGFIGKSRLSNRGYTRPGILDME